MCAVQRLAGSTNFLASATAPLLPRAFQAATHSGEVYEVSAPAQPQLSWRTLHFCPISVRANPSARLDCNCL